MKHDKDAIRSADEQGLFQDHLDAKVLSIEESEKSMLSEKLAQAGKEMSKNLPEEPVEKKSTRKRVQELLNVELTPFEKFISFLLALFGLMSREDFKKKKVIRGIERELDHIKPPIYNSNTKRITKYFAYKIHDLYLKLFWMRQAFELTLDHPEHWNRSLSEKNIAETLFERFAGVNEEEVDANFSPNAVELVVSQFEDSRRAVETIEKSLYGYVYSIDKEVISKVNKAYTNLVYFKRLADFDFESFFKRFDSTFHPGISPNFSEIPGDALINYLRDLEEGIMQIDLSMDNVHILKVLSSVASEFNKKNLPPTEVYDPQLDKLNPKNVENEIVMLFEVLKELLYKKYLTLLIQIIKADPLYSPSFVHTKQDLFKIYMECFEKRIKHQAVELSKLRRFKKIEGFQKKIFDHVHWCGIYHSELSREVESSGILGFSYMYHVAAINGFYIKYYNDLIKSALNLLLVSGSFTEKNFHKMVSDTFYGLDQFYERFEEFHRDLESSGSLGKRLMSAVSKRGSSPSYNEFKKLVEKQIVSINGKARDYAAEFFKLFTQLETIFQRIYEDVDAKPPRYIRNIRQIGGFRNVKFLQTVEKSKNLMLEMENLKRALGYD